MEITICEDCGVHPAVYEQPKLCASCAGVLRDEMREDQDEA